MPHAPTRAALSAALLGRSRPNGTGQCCGRDLDLEHVTSNVPKASLAGLRVVSFESRRAADVARLIRKHGGDAVEAPSMREIPLETQDASLAFGERLMAGECDALVLLTGVGTTLLVEALCTRWERPDVLARLGQTPLLCRGPKPVLVLKSLGLQPRVVAPSPNTHRELIGAIEGECDLQGKRLYVQEYGTPNDDLMRELARLGAIPRGVSVYRWGLPTDTAPLERALRGLARGEADVAVFTSAHQVGNVLDHATSLGIERELRAALDRDVVVASVGPVTSAALERVGLRVDLCPTTPKMGPLIVTLARLGPTLSQDKRAAPAPAGEDA